MLNSKKILHMKKIIILIVLFFTIFTGCTSKFEEFNTDKTHPSDVGPAVLLTNAEIELSNQISSTNVNINIWKLIAQYWTERTYTDECNYNITNRRISDNMFRRYYAILKDLDDAKNKIANEKLEEPNLASKKVIHANKLAITDLLEVYIYQRLVDMFGNVPYSEALKSDNYTPKYDDAATIYADLVKRVIADTAALDPSDGSFGSADLIYSGDVAKWKMFANSLLVKLAINLADVDPTTSKTAIEGAYDKVFKTVADGAYFPYQKALPYVNPLYQDLILSGRHDFLVCATLFDTLKGLQDPRMKYYFDNMKGGQLYGKNGGHWGDFSHFNMKLAQPDFPGILMTYDEVMFYLAEAAARGYSVGKTAQEYYNDAVTTSIEWWGGSASDAATYLAAHPYTSYTNWKEAIGLQAWIAMYTRGFIGYTFYRRLDQPDILVMPPHPYFGLTSIPTRFPYPISEQTLNAANYQAAASAIGGDKMSTKIFWDKN
jgi:hypothetical protein